MENQKSDTSTKASRLEGLKTYLKRCRKPFAYALIGMVPFVVLWLVVVWLLAKCT